MEKGNDKSFVLANVKDKINMAKKRNKIQNTVFYTAAEKILIEKELRRGKREKLFFLWWI